MSKSVILTMKDDANWTRYLRANFSLLMNVYFTPEYYKLFEDNGDGIAECFIYDDGSNIALYPFLLNKINDLGYVLDKTYYDIQGAYGYNGIIYSSHEPDFVRSFYAEFYKYCKANNIIAEFTRFNPILKNEIFSREYLNVSFNRNIIYLDLSDNYSKIYSQYSSGIKSNLKKANDNDLTVSVFYKSFPYKKEFIKMYIETMDSVGAEKYYYFSNKFFDGLFKISPFLILLFFKKIIL